MKKILMLLIVLGLVFSAAPASAKTRHVKHRKVSIQAPVPAKKIVKARYHKKSGVGLASVSKKHKKARKLGKKAGSAGKRLGSRKGRHIGQPANQQLTQSQNDPSSNVTGSVKATKRHRSRGKKTAHRRTKKSKGLALGTGGLDTSQSDPLYSPDSGMMAPDGQGASMSDPTNVILPDSASADSAVVAQQDPEDQLLNDPAANEDDSSDAGWFTNILDKIFPFLRSDQTDNSNPVSLNSTTKDQAATLGLSRVKSLALTAGISGASSVLLLAAGILLKAEIS